MKKEFLQPFPNLPKTRLLGTALFQLRLFFDFQVYTVYRSLKAFFKARDPSRVLEVGGGLNPYRHLIKAGFYCSLEHYHLQEEFGYRSECVKYDGAHFPFKSESFDVVFHTEVMEHIFDTHFFLAECSRVLKGNGAMFFTVPFSARFHYQPHDYWRFTPSSLQTLCASHGFAVASIAPRGDALIVILNKIMVLFLGMAVGRNESRATRIFSRLMGFTLSALLLPILAVVGQVFLKTGWFKNTDDCLGFSVTCIKKSE